MIGTALIGGSGASRAVTGFTSATAEDISMFESAILTGWSYRERYTGVGQNKAFSGGERNVFAVGTASGSLLVNGATRTGILAWGGIATLNGSDGNDEYVIDLAGVHGTVQLPEGDGPGVDGPDTLTIVGSNLRETGRVTLGGSLFDADHNQNVETTQFTLDDGQGVPATLIVSRFVETTGLYLRGGNDALAIRGLNLALTVDAGDGDDVVLVGSQALERENRFGTGSLLDDLKVSLVVRGGAGTDILRSDDSGDTTNNTGTLTATLLTGLGTQGIDYGAFEAFGLYLGSGNDTLTVTSTHAGTVDITTGAGTDTVNVVTTAGAMTLDTGDQADTVTIRAIGATPDAVDAPARAPTSSTSAASPTCST